MKSLLRGAAFIGIMFFLAFLLWGIFAIVPNRQGRGMLLASLQAPLSHGFTWISDTLEYVDRGAALVRENRDLREQNSRLQGQELRLKYIESRNRRLLSLLELRAEYVSEVVVAGVAARSPNLWDSELLLDKGASEGVTTDLVAMSATGLVGRVVAVGANSCRVRMILDGRLAVPVVLGESGATGVLYNEGNLACVMKYVRHDVQVKEGEAVLTSGLGDVYPAGLLVGRVGRVSGSTEVMFQSVQVFPSADFNHLQEVLLLKKGSRRLSPDKLELLQEIKALSMPVPVSTPKPLPSKAETPSATSTPQESSSPSSSGATSSSSSSESVSSESSSISVPASPSPGGSQDASPSAPVSAPPPAPLPLPGNISVPTYGTIPTPAVESNYSASEEEPAAESEPVPEDVEEVTPGDWGRADDSQ